MVIYKYVAISTDIASKESHCTFSIWLVMLIGWRNKNGEICRQVESVLLIEAILHHLYKFIFQLSNWHSNHFCHTSQIGMVLEKASKGRPRYLNFDWQRGGYLAHQNATQIAHNWDIIWSSSDLAEFTFLQKQLQRIDKGPLKSKGGHTKDTFF